MTTTVLRTRDHSVDDYAVLRDMDATDVGVLGQDDRICLEELGRYLVSTDAWQRFGVWLLHKHFEPGPGEVFVEQRIDSRREIETATFPKAEFGAAELDMTAIRFIAPVEDEISLIGMEFAEASEFVTNAPIGDDDAEVLAGVADVLVSHGKIDRFGVRLVRNPLSLNEQEILNETCDKTNRTLHYQVRNRDDVLSDKTTIQTAWRWKVVDGESEPVVMMDCTLTCAQTADGHDASVIHKAYG